MSERYERYRPDWKAYHHHRQTGPCFICQIVARHPDYPAHIIYEDDVAIAFLDKYPRNYGDLLVAPLQHKEQVAGDFTVDEYIDLQKRLYRVAEALRQEVKAERIYLLSLGSNQGNAHVHWLVIPLPPGVPYEEQQLRVFEQDVLKIPESEKAALAARVRQRIERSTRDETGTPHDRAAQAPSKPPPQPGISE